MQRDESWNSDYNSLFSEDFEPETPVLSADKIKEEPRDPGIDNIDIQEVDLEQKLSQNFSDSFSLAKIKTESFDSDSESCFSDLTDCSASDNIVVPVAYQFQLVNHNKISLNLKKAELDKKWFKFQKKFKERHPVWSLSVAALFYQKAAEQKLRIVNKWWDFQKEFLNPNNIKPVALDY